MFFLRPVWNNSGKIETESSSNRRRIIRRKKSTLYFYICVFIAFLLRAADVNN